MAWQDRLKEAAYTSPSGNRITFDYENVSKNFDKKIAAFNFPDADGSYIQDLGHSGRRYPLRVIFWGNDYDLDAQVFESLLQERGTGKLDHPIYGTVDVVPFGTIKQRDDLKTSANQAIIEVVFWETIGLVYPISQTDPASEALKAVNDFNDKISNELENTINLNTAFEKSNFKNTYDNLLTIAASGLQSIADTQDDVKSQFDAIFDSINNSVDVLISDPLTLAFQTTRLIQLPALAITLINARISAYSDLSDSIFSGSGASVNTINDLHTNDLYASTYVTGSILSVINNNFVTKTEAIEAAESVIEQFDNLKTWRDDNFKLFNEIDTGEAYQKLLDAVALTAGFLVEISFSLKQERRFILTRNRTIVDLVAELYGELDNQFDFFIESNELSGSEILELPKGREIVYYI